MTVPRDEPHVTSDAEATEEAALPLDGGIIYVCQDGPRYATALALIHGSGSSSRTWGPMTRLLSASHRVIRVDLLGHGQSDKPADGDYKIPAQARRVAGALDWLGVDHVIVVGRRKRRRLGSRRGRRGWLTRRIRSNLWRLARRGVPTDGSSRVTECSGSRCGTSSTMS